MISEKKPKLLGVEQELELEKKNVTANNIKEVYEFLEKKQAEPASFVVEALVGLIRGQHRADPKSVELYMKKHEGFMIGINRVNIRKLNLDHCDEHLDKLKSYRTSLEIPQL